MKLQIKNTEITLKYSFRSLIIYEKIAGKSFEPKTLGDIIIYFYSSVLGSSKDFTLTYDEFLDWLDENPSAIADFSKWLASVAAVNQQLSNNSTDSETQTETEDTAEKNV